MYKLILKTEEHENVIANLRSIEQDLLEMDGFRMPNVYSDSEYKIQLFGDEDRQKNILQVRLYVNDDYIPSVFYEGKIVIQGNERKMFHSCFGFAKITLEIRYKDGERETLFSDYLSILFREGYLSNKVDAMYDYIFENERNLLYKNEQTIATSSFSGSDRTDSVLAKLNLAEETARFYENNFGYFKSNSRFKVKETHSVEGIEKLQKMTPETLTYIAMHPEELQPMVGASGIRIDCKNYYPKKAMIPVQNISTDIYENQIIVGFLSTIIDDLSDISKKLNNLVSRIPDQSSTDGPYVHSATLILKKTEKTLREKVEKANVLLNKFETLRNLYQAVLNVSRLDVNNPPKPTAVFLSVPNYNMIFTSICKWFNYGEFDVSEEAFMLSFVNLSSLYELFALCRIINDLCDMGYVMEKSTKHTYVVNDTALYKNSDCINTFIFTKADETLSLYYQPVIYQGGNRNNRTGLYRNTSISYGEEGRIGNYFTPDFIIKRNKNGVSTYDILDAKFMNRDNATRKVPELSYKYLFAISENEPADSIQGLYVLYGRPDLEDRAKSIYDFDVVENRTSPRAMLIPLADENSGLNMTEYIIKQ